MKRQPISLTPLDMSRRFIGVEEVEGPGSNPLILAMLRMVQSWPGGDDIPWCSAFVFCIASLLGLPTPPKKSALAARSWLGVGDAVAETHMEPGFDIVVLSRGSNPAQGHVGFFAGYGDRPGKIKILGGNQNDMVSVADFDAARIVGVRRL